MNTNTNINVPQSLNSIQLNSYDYVNKGINDIALEYFNLINPEQKKSIQTLFIGVGILIGADIFKSIVQNIIRDNQKNINEFILNGFELFTFSNIKNYFHYTKNNFLSVYKHCRRAVIKEKHNNNLISKDNKLLFEIYCDGIFCDNLVMLLENYKTNKNNYELINEISFNDEYDSTLNINQSDTKIKKNLYNIKIIYKNDLVTCIDKISYEYNYNGDSIKFINNNLSFYNMFTKKYTQFKEIYFLAEEFNFFEVKENGIITGKNGIVINVKNIMCDNLSNYILQEIYKINKSMNNINVIMTNLTILTNAINKSMFNNNSNQTIIEKIILNLSSKFNRYSQCYGICQHIYDLIMIKSIEPKINIDDMLMDFDSLLNSSNNEENYVQPNTTDVNFKINFEIENKYDESQKELNDKLVNFIDYVRLISKKHKINKKINIYTINSKINNTIQKTDNPEYIKYVETKKKLLEENKNLTTKDIINLIGNEPDQYICTEKINYEIEKKIVNTKYCSFDNLYLRKQQDMVLFNLTERFLHDKKMMEGLGIPNKLCVLLYGEPGCGKTTTIITLGSYLGRDIFYLNLKSIKTNGELKMIFDYVNSEHSGGGIIVLEDIDAMTNIVMDRTKLNISIDKPNKNELVDSEEDIISLEYLLNLLDGTLTYNESVVVITTNHLDKLDPALYRPGRIDNLIEMKKCDHYQISKIYKKFIGRDIDLKVLEKINENEFTPAKIIFHLINWVKKRDELDKIIMNDFIV